MTEKEDRDTEDPPPKRDRGKGGSHVGIRQVAKAAGISVASVSRTLNKPETVSDATRRRVHAAVEDLNYVPNAAARFLSLQRHEAIGAIVPTLDYSIFAQFITAMQDEVSRAGYSLILSTTGFEPDKELDQARALVGHGMAALSVAGERHDPKLYDLLASRNIPYNHVSVFNPESAHPSVGYDNVDIGRQVAGYLLDLGHREIGAVISHRATNDRMMQRMDGARAVLAAHDVALPEARIVERRFSIAEGRVGFRELVTRDPAITALICGNDVLAFGCILEAQAMGLSVPDDISIVGNDNLELAGQIEPSLTTVRISTFDMGTAAAQHLLRQLRGEPGPKDVEIPFSLVPRGSTAPPRRS